MLPFLGPPRTRYRCVWIHQLWRTIGLQVTQRFFVMVRFIQLFVEICALVPLNHMRRTTQFSLSLWQEPDLFVFLDPNFPSLHACFSISCPQRALWLLARSPPPSYFRIIIQTMNALNRADKYKSTKLFQIDSFINTFRMYHCAETTRLQTGWKSKPIRFQTPPWRRCRLLPPGNEVAALFT